MNSAPTDTTPEHVDVVIVGAGLSGVGAAFHLQRAFPDRRYVILEARDAVGGTWDLFRYPGVRSDSDMYTLGYRFRPWVGAKAIADGESIRSYVRSTARDAGIDRHIRFGHLVVSASWSSAEARWTVRSVSGADEVTTTCSFLYVCAGYYRYDRGYLPTFPGIEDYEGRLVHPQHWPTDLDYSGKDVVVVGSGATAVTLVPAMSGTANRVTMLQRSPTYIFPAPSKDVAANALRRVLGPRLAYPIVRWKNVIFGAVTFPLIRRHPRLARKVFRHLVSRLLPEDFDVDVHFNPTYDPWDQRVCLVPDGDLFASIREGRASVVTDRIAGFTSRGIVLESGRTLDADVVVSATGLELLALGGIEFFVDGERADVSQAMAYKAAMLSGLPNLAFTIGYTNASWTLKADLVSEYVCRVLRHMDRNGYDVCVPINEESEPETAPLLDFSSGYVRRAIHTFPSAGTRSPWRLTMSYPADLLELRHGAIDDKELHFRRVHADRLPRP